MFTRRLLTATLAALMPLFAAAQAIGAGPAQQQADLLLARPSASATYDEGTTVPLWKGSDGHQLSLKSSKQPGAEALGADAPLPFRALDAANLMSTGVRYELAPHLQAEADISQRSWVNSSAQVMGSEVGATYSNPRYSLGLSVSGNSVPNDARLPRILPGGAPGFAGGLSNFDSSTQLNARGRLALDGKSGIDLGASVGRIRLLPGNPLGINSVDQKALSFGVDHGSISGTIVGRTMQPDVGAGLVGAYAPPERRWSSIDLGVTWRLPWQGSLSIGAQNLWSSGSPVNTPAGPEPDQSRTPYVQYHQDL